MIRKHVAEKGELQPSNLICHDGMIHSFVRYDGENLVVWTPQGERVLSPEGYEYTFAFDAAATGLWEELRDQVPLSLDDGKKLMVSLSIRILESVKRFK
jgi:hypothetical protein